MVGPRKQDFWPRINILKGIKTKFFDELQLSKSAKVVLSKSIFDVKNQSNFFKKIFYLKI
jgi:hypothetical protein